MGSFVVLPLSALGLWRRGSKTQGGEPGAPGFNSWLYSVAGAAAIALARRRAGRPLERRLVAHPIRAVGDREPWQQPAGGQFLCDPLANARRRGAGVILYFT